MKWSDLVFRCACMVLLGWLAVKAPIVLAVIGLIIALAVL
jgi:hypothetical protein